MMHKLCERGEIRKYVDSMDTFLFDMDGVLWHGDDVLEGVREVLELLRKMNKRILFVTNNSTKSRSSYVDKFKRLGMYCVVEEVFGSAYAAAYYLKHILQFPKDKKVFIIGQEGIKHELEAEEIAYCGINEDNDNMKFGEWNTVKPDMEVGAVVMGFDVDINYKKIAKAFTFLYSNPECHFLVTNKDITYPANGTVYPGTGALVACISTPLGRDPIVCGKPTKTMLECIVKKYHLNPSTTCMVGDRLDTDIAFGHMGGFSTLLVLTGVTHEKDLETSVIKPDFYMDNLGVLRRMA